MFRHLFRYYSRYVCGDVFEWHWLFNQWIEQTHMPNVGGYHSFSQLKVFFCSIRNKKKNSKYYFFSCLLEHFMEFFLPLTSRWKSLCEISSLPPFRMQFKWTALLGPRPSPPVGAVLGFPVSVACQLTFLRILSLYNVRREFLVFNPPSQLGPGQILLQPLCASQPLEHFTAQQEGFFSLLLFFKSTIQESL